MNETEIKENMQQLINEFDKNLVQFGFQAKLNGMGNTWIYHQIKIQIEKQDERLQPYLIQWLDSRCGDYKMF